MDSRQDVRHVASDMHALEEPFCRKEGIWTLSLRANLSRMGGVVYIQVFNNQVPHASSSDGTAQLSLLYFLLGLRFPSKTTTQADKPD